MLEDQRVAGRELRRENAGNLIIREIPWLDRQEDAERLVHQHRLAFGGIEHRQLLRLQQVFRMPNIIFEDLGGEFHLGLRFGDQLTHFQRQQAGKSIAVPAQDVCGILQDTAALGEGGFAPTEESRVCFVQRGLHLLVRCVGKGRNSVSGIGIDGRVGHCPFSCGESDFGGKGYGHAPRSFTACTICVSTAWASP